MSSFLDVSWGNRKLICCLFTMTCSLCVFQRSISPRLWVEEYCCRLSAEIVIENPNVYSGKGTQLSCPHLCTILLRFEPWWLLLLACFIFNQGWTHCVRPKYPCMQYLFFRVTKWVLWESDIWFGVFPWEAQVQCTSLWEAVFSDKLTGRMNAELLNMSGCYLNLGIPPFLLLEILKWLCCCSWALAASLELVRCSCLMEAVSLCLWRPVNCGVAWKNNWFGNICCWKLIGVAETYISVCSDFVQASVTTCSLSHTWLMGWESFSINQLTWAFLEFRVSLFRNIACHF